MKDSSFYKPGMLVYDFANCSGEITAHPLLNAHCKNDFLQTADMIARYLDNLEKNFRDFYSFCGPTEDNKIVSTPDELIIFPGVWMPEYDDVVVPPEIETGKFPENEFMIIREDKNSISLECSWFDFESGYGNYWIEQENNYYGNYILSKFTFLSENVQDLPDNLEIKDSVPMCERGPLPSGYEWKWIIKDPFGLCGYFLFEEKTDDHYFGMGPEANPWNLFYND